MNLIDAILCVAHHPLPITTPIYLCTQFATLQQIEIRPCDVGIAINIVFNVGRVYIHKCTKCKMEIELRRTEEISVVCGVVIVASVWGLIHSLYRCHDSCVPRTAASSSFLFFFLSFFPLILTFWL